MSVRKSQFYNAFGEILYTLAVADGEIHEVELDTMNALLANHEWAIGIKFSFNYENKKKRDIGKLAIERTEAIERIINKGSENAKRCVELASGAEHTEEELKATRKSQINPECPSLANPNYVEYQ